MKNWQIGTLISLILTTPAWADIVSTGYVGEYFRDMCNNSYLTMPSSASGIASQKYVLEIVDYLNDGATTHAATLVSDAIVGNAYMPGAFNLLGNSPMCCPGGYYNNDVAGCRDCGAWLTTTTLPDCTIEGKYRNGSSCATCPTDYTCPAGTNGKVSNAVLVQQCLAAGIYRKNNKCTACELGYYCAADTNDRENCGVGYYCTGGVRTECEYGPGQCPTATLGAQPTTVACDDVVSALTATTLPDCTEAGEYRNGSSCATCPDGYTCPAGTNGKISDATIPQQCLDFGEYRLKNVCTACGNGYYCPAGQNERENCGIGYYCVAGVKTECEYGAGQCPTANLTSQPTTIACDDVATALTTTTLPDCTAAGEYRNGSSCATCPDGYTCPAGTNGKYSNATIPD